MVTEPEAAAMYTARYLKKEMQKDFLKVSPFISRFCRFTDAIKISECFVLCDAGGGTVVSGPKNNSNVLITESTFRMLFHTESQNLSQR